MPHQQHDARRPSGQHSFRGDPSQSFLAPQSSFRPQYYDGRPGSSSSRPPTGQSLPPLAAVVSASIPSPSADLHQPPLQHFPFPAHLPSADPAPHLVPELPHQAAAVAPLPLFSTTGPPAHPLENQLDIQPWDWAAAASYTQGSAPPLAAAPLPLAYSPTWVDTTPPTNQAVVPPPVQPSPRHFSSSHPPSTNSSNSSSRPRRRPPPLILASAHSAPPTGLTRTMLPPAASPHFHPPIHSAGSDWASGWGSAPPDASSSGGGGGGYEYGTESRPQSRRLSVMELCNDDAQRQQQANQATLAHALAATERERYASAGYAPPNGHGHGAPAPAAFLLPAAASAEPGGGYGGGYGLSPSASGERPATATTALASSASALHIFDSDGSNDGRRYSNGSGHAAHGNGNGSGSGSASPAGAVYDAAGRGGYPGGGQSPRRAWKPLAPRWIRIRGARLILRRLSRRQRTHPPPPHTYPLPTPRHGACPIRPRWRRPRSRLCCWTTPPPTAACSAAVSVRCR